MYFAECELRNAEFRKGVSCGSKIAENVLVVELCQLNKCTILQSAHCVLQKETVR